MRTPEAVLWIVLIVLITAIGLLPTVASAQVAPIVGTDCTLSWSPVTTNEDGSAVTGVITYNVYMAAGAATAQPAVPKITGITAFPVKPCVGMPSGVYRMWGTAVETPVPGGSSSESAALVIGPFSIAVPRAPAGAALK